MSANRATWWDGMLPSLLGFRLSFGGSRGELRWEEGGIVTGSFPIDTVVGKSSIDAVDPCRISDEAR